MSDSDSILLKEFIGTDSNGSTYKIDTLNGVISLKESTQESPFSNSIKALLKSVFLPENFPNSVSEDYIEYQIWDTIQAFCSSISGALAARAMFESIGVGDDSATAYGATFIWLIKDGMGMMGKILFAWCQGSFLDSNSKMWRLYADILNDFSFFVDMLTLMFPRDFSIYLMSFSGILRSIVGIAGGATRSALTQHQAIDNNLADVSAKDSSQETLVNLLALIVNLLILNFVKDSKYLIWPLFIFFVIGHIYANYNAVKSVVIKTLNRNRFHILTQHFLKTGCGHMLDVQTVNLMEPIFYNVRRYFKDIRFGCSLKEFRLNQKKLNGQKLSMQNFLVNFDISKEKVCVILNQDCNDQTYLKALLQIEIVEFVIENSKNERFLYDSPTYKNLKFAINTLDYDLIENESFSIANWLYKIYIKEASDKGWSFVYTQFSPNVFRYILDDNNKKLE